MSDPLAEIKRLYYATSKATIARDFDRAIDLLKSMPDEHARERATVYMEGLASMRRQWMGPGGRTAVPGSGGTPAKPRPRGGKPTRRR